MDIEAVRSIVIEEAEAHYHFVDEYGFSKIAREEIVEEGDGGGGGRCRSELQDKTDIGSEDKRRIEKPIEQPIEKTVEEEPEPPKEIPPTAEEIEDDGLETRTEDREDQDFDSSQFNEEMFA